MDSILVAAIQAHASQDAEVLESLLRTIPSAGARLEHLVRHSVATAVGHGAGLESLAGVSPQVRRTLEEQDARRRALVGRILAEGVDSGDFRPDLVPADDAVLLTCALDGAASLAAARPDELTALTARAVRTPRAPGTTWVLLR